MVVGGGWWWVGELAGLGLVGLVGLAVVMVVDGTYFLTSCNSPRYSLYCFHALPCCPVLTQIPSSQFVPSAVVSTERLPIPEPYLGLRILQ